MVEEKGLSEDVADAIGQYVKLCGRFDLVEKLTSDPKLMAVKDATLGLEDMKLLLQYCDNFGVLEKVCVCVCVCVCDSWPVHHLLTGGTLGDGWIGGWVDGWTDR